MCAHVMLAEDDRRQAEALRRYLVAAGHRATVVADGEAALREARQQPFDLLLLDVMLPKLDGMQVCRMIRQESDVPVLMLTARSAEDDLLRGLDLGADDYMTKPYSPRELVARVRTLLRRVRTVPQESPVHRLGRLTVDEPRRLVTAGGVPVDCTTGEFAILAAMIRQPGRVFSRGQLLEHTRGIDRESTGRTIDVHVMNLRRKIEANPRRPQQLLTVYGVGYKLSAGAS
ncbi:response regulator transcription factor [Micromonospora sp. WMMD987]|uniref:response regulator transcription factor n=1 Tax=Micromonospora sp. WMMD987 TaxID=3016089 RepID=UPI00249CE1FE|nr:response regulator transcription factor [Micromonospora sp. WMMD987]WFE97632.1 response regulator transcription factor [Micromonospora sp. WMMD987]